MQTKDDEKSEHEGLRSFTSKLKENTLDDPSPLYSLPKRGGKPEHAPASPRRGLKQEQSLKAPFLLTMRMEYILLDDYRLLHPKVFWHTTHE